VLVAFSRLSTGALVVVADGLDFPIAPWFVATDWSQRLWERTRTMAGARWFARLS